MDGHLEHDEINLNALRGRIAASTYLVDPLAVADAIVRRRWSLAIGPEPDSSPVDRRRRRTRVRVSCIPRHGLPRRTDALAA